MSTSFCRDDKWQDETKCLSVRSSSSVFVVCVSQRVEETGGKELKKKEEEKKQQNGESQNQQI